MKGNALKNELKLALMQWVYGLTELLWYMPIAMTFGIALFGDYSSEYVFLFLLGFPIIFTLGLLFAELFRDGLAFIRFILLFPACGAACWYLLAVPMGGFTFYLIIAFAIYVYVGLRGCSYARKRWRELFPRGMVWLGYIFYAIAVPMYPRVAAMGDIEPVYSTPILVMGIVYVFGTMFLTNIDTLRKASGGEYEHVSKKHQLFNWLLLGGLTLCIIIVSFMRKLAAWFEKLATYVVSGLFWLYNAITELLSDNSSGEGASGSGGMDLSDLGEMPDNPDSEFTLLFVKILGYTVIVLFIIFIVWKFGKAIVNGLKSLYERILNSMQGNASVGGYYDTEEKLTGLKELGKIYSDKFKKWREERKREPAYSELTDNRARVRWIYRYYMNRRIDTGFNFSPAQTPTEALGDAERHRSTKKRGRVVRDTSELASAYNEVRYGRECDVTDESVERMKKTFIKS